MISSILGFLLVLGCVGIGFFVLICGFQFLIVILFVIGTCLAACIEWIKKQFSKL